MVRLVVKNHEGVEKEYQVSREMVIGRNRENDIRIKEEKASRRHCRVRPDAGRVLLEDLESSNGTRVNGSKIKTIYVLKHGDTIKIGKTTIVFQDEDQQLDRTVALPSIDDHVLPDAPAPAAAKRAEKAKPAPAVADDDDADDDADDVIDDEEVEVAEAAPAEPAAKVKPAVAEKSRSRRDTAETTDHVYLLKLLVPVAAVVLFIVTVVVVVNYAKDFRGAGKAAPAGNTDSVVAVNEHSPEPPPQPPAQIISTTPGPAPIAPPLPLPPPVAPVVPDRPGEAELQTQLARALAERDKALGSGNYPAARSVIQSFAAAHPEGAVGAKARQEWKDTTVMIDAMLEPMMAMARKAADERKYNIATQRCTKVLAADASGKFGAQARELLANIDLETEPRFAELHGQAQELLRAGKIHDAAEALRHALEELGGTKWGSVISADQLQVVYADNLLEKMEAERQKRAAAGKDPVLKLPSKKLEGELLKVHGVNLDIKTEGGTLQVPLKSIDLNDFGALLKQLGLGESRLDRAYLWLALDRKDAVRTELDAALQDPEQASAAAALAGAVFEDRNFHAWDFSKWQHQSDWTAQSGSWSTQNGKYVLDSPEGGDTSLRTDAIGGKYPAAKARISFDFELTAPKDGFLFAFEFGPDDQHFVSAIFNAAGVSLSSNLGAPANAQDKSWTPGPTHVEIAVNGETFSVSLNGKPAQNLQAPGLANLLGTITFRARESACSITHVILRHAD